MKIEVQELRNVRIATILPLGLDIRSKFAPEIEVTQKIGADGFWEEAEVGIVCRPCLADMARIDEWQRGLQKARGLKNDWDKRWADHPVQ